MCVSLSLVVDLDGLGTLASASSRTHTHSFYTRLSLTRTLIWVRNQEKALKCGLDKEKREDDDDDEKTRRWRSFLPSSWIESPSEIRMHLFRAFFLSSAGFPLSPPSLSFFLIFFSLFLSFFPSLIILLLDDDS